jgi:hypothetical protein
LSIPLLLPLIHSQQKQKASLLEALSLASGNSFLFHSTSLFHSLRTQEYLISLSLSLSLFSLHCRRYTPGAGFVDTHYPSRAAKCESALKQCQHQLSLLASVWREVLPAHVYLQVQ